MDYRKTDANLNRACEGVRVLEDTVRFDLNREDLTRECRSLRHDLRTLFAPRMAQLIASRDSETDVGVPVSRAAADDGRCGLPSVIAANSKRIQEALRVLEESLKGNGFYEEAKKAEALRFRSYTLEKKVTAAVLRRLPEGLYGITAEKFAAEMITFAVERTCDMKGREMTRMRFRNVSLAAVASLTLLAAVQCVWAWRIYRDAVDAFQCNKGAVVPIPSGRSRRET